MRLGPGVADCMSREVLVLVLAIGGEWYQDIK